MRSVQIEAIASPEISKMGERGAGKPPPRRRYLDRRDSVLAAAARLLARGGEDFSVAAVARELDMHPVSLTYYYKRKEDLAAAVLRDTLARTGELLAAAACARTPQLRLGAFLRGYFELRRAALVDGCTPLVRFGEIRLAEGEARRELEASLGQIHLGLARALKSPDMPWMTTERRQSLARLVISLMTWTDPWLWQYAPEDFERVAERLTALMIHGLPGGGSDWSLPEASGAVARGEDDDTRERLLYAATRLINLDGYRGMSVDRVSAELNLTKGAFYHHLVGKEDLLAACFTRTMRLIGAAQAKGRGVGSGWDRLSQILGALADLQLDGPGEQLLRPTALAAGPEALQRAHLGQYLQAANSVADVVGQGVEDGSVRPVDPTLASHYLLVVLTVLGSLRQQHCVPGLGLREAYLRPALTGFFKP